LLAWQGTRTGIPRVVSNLVRRYAEQSDVGFFVFSDRSGSFRQVDNAIAAEAAQRRWTAAPTSIPHLGPYLRKLSGMAVASLRRRLPPSTKRVLRQLGGQALGLWAGFAGRSSGYGRSLLASMPGLARMLAGRDRRAVPFLPNDRVLVLGAGWASASLQRALAEQKRMAGVRIYQVLYDLTPVLLPQCFGPGFPQVFTRYFFEAAALSDGLISISMNSRADALRFCQDLLMKPPPIEVFRLGDEVSADGEQLEPVESLQGSRFILSVGTVESRKNQLLLYQAWKLALESGRALPDLVIVGRIGWAAGDTVYAIKNDPAVRDAIHLLNEVKDAELEWLYASLYEGWGLPIAESLARGKVCLASSSSAMPEVAGDLIQYFSPHDAGECLRLIERYLDAGVLSAKARQITEEYAITTWDEAFHRFETALDRLADGADPRTK
jgi:hypothetical protein